MSYLGALIGIVVSLFFILFFAGMEAAFFTINKLSIELKKKQGKQEGVLAARFADKPASFIGACVFGIIFCLVVYGLFFNHYFNSVFWAKTNFEIKWIELLLNVIISVLFVVFFGRFLARLLFNRNEKLFYKLLSFFSIFAVLFERMTNLFVNFSNGILKYLFNIRIKSERHPFNRMPVEPLFQQAKDMKGDFNEELNSLLFENALMLPAVKARHCLIPRTEISSIPIDLPIEDVRQRFIGTQQSRLVVYENNIDNILGYVMQHSVFKQPASIRDILIPVFTVPESMGVIDLLSRFSKERKSLAWVVDEFGGTAGVVTVENILAKLFGEMQDEEKDKLIEQKISQTEFIFSGRLELDYLNEKYHLEFPEHESETLSGYIIRENKSIPKQEERIFINDYEFEIISLRETTIGTVKMRVLR